MSFERREMCAPALFDNCGLIAETFRQSPPQSIPEASPLPDVPVPWAPQASSPQGSIGEPLQWLGRVQAVIASPKQSASTKVALFSLAGGVGKTTLATTIARFLSGRSVHTVLVHCSAKAAVTQGLPEKAPRLAPLSSRHAPSGKGSVTVIHALP